MGASVPRIHVRKLGGREVLGTAQMAKPARLGAILGGRGGFFEVLDHTVGSGRSVRVVAGSPADTMFRRREP
jgi:hypothetical protein